MKPCARTAVAIVTTAALARAIAPLDAHSGPPFPVIKDRVAGAYRISIWTDPDTTNDGSAGGQFWVIVQAADSAVPLPSQTRASISISPVDREGSTRSGRTEPVANDVTRQFAALLMDHEGRFAVRVKVEGPLGEAVVDSEVDATYDLRPAPYMIAVYVMPFVLVGFLWLKLLWRRRGQPHTYKP